MAEKGAAGQGGVRGPVGESLDDRGDGAARAAADVAGAGVATEEVVPQASAAQVATDAGGAAIGGQKPVAKSAATRGQRDAATGGPANLLEFKAERANRQSSQAHPLATRGQISATRGQSKLTRGARRSVASGHYVEAVKASKGTWAFRIRWRDVDGKRPVVYVSRVSDVVFDLIKGGDYEAFKRQLIAGHSASTLRSSHTA